MVSTVKSVLQLSMEAYNFVNKVNISVSAELMKNYMAGRSFSAEHSIAVVHDSNGYPMLFTIDNTNAFCVIMRQPNSSTGWQQIDLSTSLGIERVAQTFAVSQDQNGSIRLALVMESKTQVGASELYITEALSNDPTQTNWTVFNNKWKIRPYAQGKLTITEIIMGTNNDTGKLLPLIVATKQEGKDAAYWQVNTDVSTTSSIWQPCQLPMNAQEILDIVIGNHRLGYGIYALYRNDGETILTFTTLYREHKINIDLTVPPQATKLAVLPNNENYSDLYVAGDGLYIFKSSNQLSGAHYETIATSQAFPRTQDFIVCQDANNIAIWARTADGNLLYTTGRKSDQMAWNQPIVLRTAVAQIAALRNQARMTNEIFIVGADDKTLAYLWQDPNTTLWKETDISLRDTKKIINFNSYVTHIKLSDENNFPLINTNVELTASEWVYVTINGINHVLDASHPVTVRSDVQGTITIINKVSNITTPIFHLKADFVDQIVDINPAEKIKNGLAKIKKGDDWLHQTTQDGKPLLKGNENADQRDTAAKAVQQLLSIINTLPKDGSTRKHSLAAMAVVRTPDESISHSINISHLDDGHCWGVQFDADSPQFLGTQEAQEYLMLRSAQVNTTGDTLMLVNTSAANDLITTLGDILESLWHGLEKAASFIVRIVDGVVEFIIDLGKRIVKFVIETVEQVFKTINWILKELLGIDLEAFIKWLGFIFNWNDILYTHTALRNLAEVTFNHMMAQTDKLESLIQNGFEQVRKQLIGNKLEFDRSNEIFKKRIKEVARDQDTSYLSTPQANWVQYHLSNNWESATSENVDIVGELTQTFLDTLKTEGEIIENALQEVSKDIIDKIDQLSFGEILEKLALIIGEALINSAENIALSFVEIAEVIGRAVWAILNARWDIPLITPLYENVIAPGSKLTLLDLGCLLTAIPSTIIYKTIYDKPPITKAEAEALSGAKNFQDIIQLLSGGMQAPALAINTTLSTSNTLTSPSDTDKGIARAQTILAFLMGGSRLISGYFYIVTELFDLAKVKFPKQKAQEFKFSFDLIHYALSFANANLYAATQEITPRRVIDLTLQYAQFFLRVKDGILVFYWKKKGKELNEVYREGLAWCETEFGIITIVLVAISTRLQAQEPLPTNPPLSKKDSDALLWLKAVQNFSSSTNQILSGFKSSARDRRVKAAFVAVRGFISFLLIPTLTIARASKNFTHERQYLEW